MKRVWITRAHPGAEATAERVRVLGFEPVVAPLVSVAPIAGPPIDLAGVGALAFTSANGVAAFAARSDERALPAFAVGAATARAAKDHGFADVVSADGDVEALARLIHGRSGALGGAVLHAAPAEPAGDLAGDLTARGVAVRSVVLYRTLAGALDAEAAARVEAADAVLLHSPKAARALADHLGGRAAPRLIAVCLSPAVAAPLKAPDFKAVAMAARPDEAALLARLAESLAAAP